MTRSIQKATIQLIRLLRCDGKEWSSIQAYGIYGMLRVPVSGTTPGNGAGGGRGGGIASVGVSRFLGVLAGDVRFRWFGRAWLPVFCGCPLSRLPQLLLARSVAYSQSRGYRRVAWRGKTLEKELSLSREAFILNASNVSSIRENHRSEAETFECATST